MLHGQYQWGRSRSAWTNSVGGYSSGPWGAATSDGDQPAWDGASEIHSTVEINGTGGLNLGLHVGDDPTVVAKNRESLSAELGRELVWMDQVHGAEVQVLDQQTFAPQTLQTPAKVDGLVWDTRGWRGPELALAVQVADCVPIAIMDADSEFLAVVHAGRAGVEKNVVGATMKILLERGAKPQKLAAVIGPHICGKCYAVGPQLAPRVEAVAPGSTMQTRDGQIGVDLGGAVEMQLRTAGLKQITATQLCTLENNQFYSYRRQKITGRQVLLAYRNR